METLELMLKHWQRKWVHSAFLFALLFGKTLFALYHHVSRLMQSPDMQLDIAVDLLNKVQSKAVTIIK